MVFRKKVKKTRKGFKRRVAKIPRAPRYKRSWSVKEVVSSKDFHLTAYDSAANPSNNGMLSVATGSSQTTYYVAYSMGFCGVDLPKMTIYQTEWERYRIRGVALKLIPVNQTSDVASNSTSQSNGSLGGFIHSVVDYTDYGKITNSDNGIDDIRNRITYKCQRFNKTWRRYIRPQVAYQVYSGGVGAGYTASKAPWLSTNEIDQEHYGVKLLFEFVNPSAFLHYMNYKMQATYYVEFKDPK